MHSCTHLSSISVQRFPTYETAKCSQHCTARSTEHRAGTNSNRKYHTTQATTESQTRSSAAAHNSYPNSRSHQMAATTRLYSSTDSSFQCTVRRSVQKLRNLAIQFSNQISYSTEFTKPTNQTFGTTSTAFNSKCVRCRCATIYTDIWYVVDADALSMNGDANEWWRWPSAQRLPQPHRVDQTNRLMCTCPSMRTQWVIALWRAECEWISQCYNIHLSLLPFRILLRFLLREFKYLHPLAIKGSSNIWIEPPHNLHYKFRDAFTQFY